MSLTLTLTSIVASGDHIDQTLTLTLTLTSMAFSGDHRPETNPN
jgi:hypothetical protein